MKKRYLYSLLLSLITFVLLYLVFDFGLLSIPIPFLIYIGGIFFFKDKDIRVYDANVIMHYCYLISKIDNYVNIIQNDEVNKNIKDISKAAEKIVIMLEQKPNKVTQVYDGFDYYLPQTIKILDYYVYLNGMVNKSEEEVKFQSEINQTLDYIENEFVKLQDNMNYTKMMDINASIEMFQKSNERVNRKVS